MPAILPESPSSQLQTVIRWFDALNSWNPDHLAATLSDDFVEHFLPRSVGMADWNKEACISNFIALRAITEELQITMDDIIESPGKIFVYATANGVTTTNESYFNEYSYVFRLRPDNSGAVKIFEITEFTDSKFISEFMPAERARQEALLKDGEHYSS